MRTQHRRPAARERDQVQTELSRCIERAIAISSDIRTRAVLPVASHDPADFLYDAKGEPR